MFCCTYVRIVIVKLRLKHKGVMLGPKTLENLYKERGNPLLAPYKNRAGNTRKSRMQ